jgi:chromatin remodeling complex protein RSC6
MPPKKKSAAPKAKKPAPKKAAPKKKPAAKKAAPKKKRATPAAFKAKFKPDATLSAIVGTASETRGQFMKKLWDYIKKHNLQDASDRRMIKADAKLKPFFNGAAKVSMLQLGGFVSKHISPA